MSTTSEGQEIATNIDGKYFWHHKDLDIARVCRFLPCREGRTIFGVTLYDPFLFYHDRDMSPKQNQPFIKKLFKELDENPQSYSFTGRFKKVEFLVTRNPENLHQCKFEKLSVDESSTPDEPEPTEAKSKSWSINTWLQGN